MPTKEEILDNVERYSEQDLAGFIKNGAVSYEELCSEPNFSADMRIKVKALIENTEEADWEAARQANTIEAYDAYLDMYEDGRHRDEARQAIYELEQANDDTETENAWLQVDKTDIDSLEDFIKAYPDSVHVDEANKMIADIEGRMYDRPFLDQLRHDVEDEADPDSQVIAIEKALSEKKITISDIYNEIKANHNWLEVDAIVKLVSRRIVREKDLVRYCDIDQAFIEYLHQRGNNEIVVDAEAEKKFEIAPHTTEVYFWGMPGSGKTCAVGSILNVAEHSGIFNYASRQPCQGSAYMRDLVNLFSGIDGVFRLPARTDIDRVFEMRYEFHDEKRVYPITFVDMSGETLHSMALKNDRKTLSQKQIEGLDLAHKLLTGNHKVNRKIHYFVIEYGGADRLYDKMRQYDMLANAMEYIKATGIFKTDTDMIYILVTKTDLIKAQEKKAVKAEVKKYLEEKYRSFCEGLKIICKHADVNDGQIKVMPFTLGTVCFRKLCLIDNSTATDVVTDIKSRAMKFRTGKMGRFIDKFSR